MGASKHSVITTPKETGQRALDAWREEMLLSNDSIALASVTEMLAERLKNVHCRQPGSAAALYLTGIVDILGFVASHLTEISFAHQTATGPSAPPLIMATTLSAALEALQRAAMAERDAQLAPSAPVTTFQ